MDVSLNWKGKMAFEGAGNSGFVQQLDAEAAVGGENGAGSPMEFILLGLAGCTAMDVISILQKKKQAVTDFKIKIHAERRMEHPKVFSAAVIEYAVAGRNIDEIALMRAIELSAEKYCPAQAMLGKAFPIQLIYKILNEDGKTMIKEGVYIVKEAEV